MSRTRHTLNKKDAYKYKANNFEHYNSKKCSKCKKRRRHPKHHYLCQRCWDKKTNARVEE